MDSVIAFPNGSVTPQVFPYQLADSHIQKIIKNVIIAISILDLNNKRNASFTVLITNFLYTINECVKHMSYTFVYNKNNLLYFTRFT